MAAIEAKFPVLKGKPYELLRADGKGWVAPLIPISDVFHVPPTTEITPWGNRKLYIRPFETIFEVKLF